MKQTALKTTIFLFLFAYVVQGQEPDDYGQNYEQMITETIKRQELADKTYQLSSVITSSTATKFEKEKSWRKLIAELETIPGDEKQLKISLLQNLIVGASEPFSGEAWSKIKTWGLTTYFSACDVFKYLILYVPEPYKEYAWNELGKCGPFDFNAQTGF